MAPAPLKAMAERMPRWMRSMNIGLRPHLMVCAPIITTTGRWLRTAVAVASTMARKSFPTRMCGSESRNCVKLPPAFQTRASSSRWTLFGRSRIGEVRMRSKSSGGNSMSAFRREGAAICSQRRRLDRVGGFVGRLRRRFARLDGEKDQLRVTEFQFGIDEQRQATRVVADPEPHVTVVGGDDVQRGCWLDP